MAETPDAIALAEGMVAVNAAAVGGPLMQAGRDDRPLEFLQVRPSDCLKRGGKKGKGDVSEEGAAHMQKLTERMNKPTVSQGAVLFVLNEMDDGLM